MKIWVAVVEDSHIDTLVLPFTSPDVAIAAARKEADERAWRPEDVVEEENENYLLLVVYSTEGHCAWVREVELQGRVVHTGTQEYCAACDTYHCPPLHTHAAG